MDTSTSDTKLSVQTLSPERPFPVLPDIDNRICDALTAPGTPTTSHLRKLGRGLIKYAEKHYSRGTSLSYVSQDTIYLSESRLLDATQSRRNSIMKVNKSEDYNPMVSCGTTSSNAKKLLPQVRRSERKLKAKNFVVDDSPKANACSITPPPAQEFGGSVTLLRNERRQSQSQLTHPNRICRQLSMSVNSGFISKANSQSMSPLFGVPSLLKRRSSTFANLPTAATVSGSPSTPALAAPPRKGFNLSFKHSTPSSGTHRMHDDSSLSSTNSQRQRLIKVQSKIDMTSEVMDEVRRHSRVRSHVRTNQERYKEILEQEQSNLILLLGRKFNLEKSIEAVLDAFETEMSHRRNTSLEHMSSESIMLSSISRRYSTAKASTNRHRPSVFLYRTEEVRKLNKINNAFLSALMRDDFNAKSICHLIEALEAQLYNVCERAGVTAPNRATLSEERTNPMRMAKSNLNDICWQIESADLCLNTAVDSPDELPSLHITTQFDSNNNSISVESDCLDTKHSPSHHRHSSVAKPDLNLPKHAEARNGSELIANALIHPLAKGGDKGEGGGDDSLQFAQTPEPSVVGFSLSGDSNSYEMPGGGSLRLLGFMFDAIAAAQVVDSLRRRGLPFPLAEEGGKSSVGEDSQAKAPCLQHTISTHEASEISFSKIDPITETERASSRASDANTLTGSITSSVHSSSSFVGVVGLNGDAGDILPPLNLKLASSLSAKHRSTLAGVSEPCNTTHANGEAAQAAIHPYTLRPNLVHDLRRLYKEYDYHRFIEDRRAFHKALAGNRYGDTEAYILEMNEKIERAKQLALESQKDKETDEDADVSMMLALASGGGVVSSVKRFSGSRERVRSSGSRNPSRSGITSAQMNNSGKHLEDICTRRLAVSNVEQAESKTLSPSAGAEAATEPPIEVIEFKSSQGSEASPRSLPEGSSFKELEQILLSTRTLCGLSFTVTKKILSGSASPIVKEGFKDKKLTPHHKPKLNATDSSTGDPTQVLCVRVRNENSSSPCEASLQLIREKLVNLKMHASPEISPSQPNESIKVVLEPGEAKTLAFLDPVKKNMRVHFDDALVFGGNKVSGFDNFNSLKPMQSSPNSDNLSMLSYKFDNISDPPKTKYDLNRGTQQRPTSPGRVSKTLKIPKTPKTRRAAKKPASSRTLEVTAPPMKPTTPTKEDTKSLRVIAASKKSPIAPPVSSVEKRSSLVTQFGNADTRVQVPASQLTSGGIIDDLLVAREVVDWGTPHENPVKEAIENNTVLLSILQTQAAESGEGGHDPSGESEPYAQNSVAGVLEHLPLSEKDPLQSLKAAEAVVADIVQRIAEDVEPKEAQGISGSENAPDTVHDALSLEENTPHLKRHSSDDFDLLEAPAPFGKRKTLQGKDPYISNDSVLTTPSAPTPQLPISAPHLLVGPYGKGNGAAHLALSDSAGAIDFISEQTAETTRGVVLAPPNTETVAPPRDGVELSYDNKAEEHHGTQKKKKLRPLRGAATSPPRPKFVRKVFQQTSHGAGTHSPQEEKPKKDHETTNQTFYEFSKDLNGKEMQQQLTTALKGIAQNTPEAFISRSENTGNLNVLMPSNFVSKTSQLTKFLTPRNVAGRRDNYSRGVSKAEVHIRTPEVAQSSNKNSVKPVESDASSRPEDCSAFVSNVLNMARSPSPRQQAVGGGAVKGNSDIAANDILSFGGGNPLMEPTTMVGSLEEEVRLLYMQDPVRYNAVVDEFMNLITSDLKQPTEHSESDGNKGARADGFLTGTMKVLIKEFMKQERPEVDVMPAAPHVVSPATSHVVSPAAAHVVSPATSHVVSPATSHVVSPAAPHVASPAPLPAVSIAAPSLLKEASSLTQSTLPQRSNRSSMMNRSSLGSRNSCVQVVDLAPDLASSPKESMRLSTIHSRVRDGSIKYAEDEIEAFNSGLMMPPPVAPPPLSHKPITQFVEEKLRSSANAKTISDGAGEIQRLLYEQFKAKLILSIFVSYTRRMWALKQKETRKQVFEMITKTMFRVTQVSWEFEKYRVLQLQKLIHILDRQTGRQRGWIPFYTDSNVLVKQDVSTPCPRYIHFQEQRRLRKVMCFAHHGKLLPLRLVRQDIVQSWNRHLLLGYSKYVVNSTDLEETKNRAMGGRYVPIRYFHMSTPGERARYARRARFGAAFQFVSKRYSPRIYRERAFPLPLH